MVMHARKTQRMNDGYFEKHQAHPYQNSKYSSSKSYGSSSDRYEKFRDSPNGTYRSDSPDTSPRERDRSYQSKSSYLQKFREKERENRDYKNSRDKYSDCTRSPKEKRSRDSEHRSTNDRGDEKSAVHTLKTSQLSSRDRKPMHNNCIDKRDDRERVQVRTVGDWSEHVSSSGKKYYYNCKTEVSQWEKPREWLEREQRDRRFRSRERDNHSSRDYGGTGGSSSSSARSSSMRHEKHSNSRGGSTVGGSSSKDGGARHWRDDVDSKAETRSSASSSSSNSVTARKHSLDETGNGSQQQQQDMDISPGGSTPTSEISYGTNSSQPIVAADQQAAPQGPILLANALPRLISHPMHVPTTPSIRPEASPQGTPTIVATTPSNAPGPPGGTGMMTLPPGASPHHPHLQQQSSTSDNNGVASVGGNGLQLSVDVTGHHSVPAEGPPTPTHSETPDCGKVGVPTSSPPCSSAGPTTTTTTGLPAATSLQGISSSLQALRPQGPTITPSLANYYRDDLVNHVRGWPAEILEKQANKLAEEAHIMGSIQCAKVSAELKSARSIVRLTEIQATLQEQRVLFLRQQIKELEELKSQNSFMSDDP